MKKIFISRVGDVFHGRTYVVVADNKTDASKIINDFTDQSTTTKDDVEEILLDKDKMVCSGEFHWLYDK